MRKSPSFNPRTGCLAQGKQSPRLPPLYPWVPLKSSPISQSQRLENGLLPGRRWTSPRKSQRLENGLLPGRRWTSPRKSQRLENGLLLGDRVTSSGESQRLENGLLPGRRWTSPRKSQRLENGLLLGDRVTSSGESQKDLYPNRRLPQKGMEPFLNLVQDLRKKLSREITNPLNLVQG